MQMWPSAGKHAACDKRRNACSRSKHVKKKLCQAEEGTQPVPRAVKHAADAKSGKTYNGYSSAERGKNVVGVKHGEQFS